MSISSGTRLGPYEIVSPLGAGGMGEVYRARDSRLRRDIAIKILPPQLASDRDRLLRFEQEARSASALNHPNIVTIFDVGTIDTTSFIAMELVEGKSLRNVISGGQLPLKRVLAIASQIADGLAAAHAKGIVHRDLKPENVIIGGDGRAKILDFGLAKLSVGMEETSEGSTFIKSPATASGVIMGTVGYMSPEQAGGNIVDFRSDQFSFGAILYEMISGRRAFYAPTVVDTLSSILHDEPEPIAVLRPETAAPLQWIVERCLSKEPEGRYASSSDLARDLHTIQEHLSDHVSTDVTSTVAKKRPLRKSIVASAALLGAMAVGGLLAFYLMPGEAADLSSYRFTPLVTGPGANDDASWSPDGQSIVYDSPVNGIAQLFVRSLSSSMPTQITHSSNNAWEPRWSHDGGRLFFIDQRQSHWRLSSVAVAGGSPQPVMEGAGRFDFSPDGKVIAFFRRESPNGPSFQSLWISAPAGSAPRKYTTAPFARRLYWSGYIRFSPDGKSIGVLILPWHGSSVITSREFWIIPFPSGEPYQVLRSLPKTTDNAGFSWMPDGRHIVISARLPGMLGQHLWMADTRSDTVRLLTASVRDEAFPAVSPDGEKIAFTIDESDWDIVEISLAVPAIRTLLATSRNELAPTWSPNGTQYAFVTNRNGSDEIWLKSAQEGWERPLVTEKDFGNDPTSFLKNPQFSPDGQRICYQRYGGKGNIEVWISNLAGGAPVRLLREEGAQAFPTWSPDGEWIAYSYGTAEKFGLAKIRVGGGSQPIPLQVDLLLQPLQWSPRGDWISCLTRDGLVIVSPDGKTTRLLSHENPLTQGFSKDGSTIYAVRGDAALHLLLISFDVATGTEKRIADLGSYPDVSQLSGFSINPDGKSFITSMQHERGDIWLLEGFNQKSFFQRLRAQLSR